MGAFTKELTGRNNGSGISVFRIFEIWTRFGRYPVGPGEVWARTPVHGKMVSWNTAGPWAVRYYERTVGCPTSTVYR